MDCSVCSNINSNSFNFVIQDLWILTAVTFPNALNASCEISVLLSLLEMNVVG